MSKDELEKEAEEINITYENNVFHCTKNGTKWISIDGEKWYGEEKRIEELEKENHLLGERCNQLLKDKGELTDQIADIKANCDFAIEGRDIKIKELEQKNAGLNDEVRELKLLVSSLVYEINQIWDINEMNDDLRMCAEKIDREVQLSKMAEDNRIVISALGFAIVPPKPKLDVKEIEE